VNALLWLCFALSGAAALALELLWIRSAGLVLGATAATAGAVVAGYFTGLAAGGFLARRPSGLPVRRYALLELAVAGGAVLSYGVFRLLAADGAQRALGAAGAGGRMAVVAISILPVTIALGATLPTLCQVLAAPGTVGPRGGTLYALNTVGGAAGLTDVADQLSLLDVVARVDGTEAREVAVARDDVSGMLDLHHVPARAAVTDGLHRSRRGRVDRRPRGRREIDAVIARRSGFVRRRRTRRGRIGFRHCRWRHPWLF